MKEMGLGWTRDSGPMVKAAHLMVLGDRSTLRGTNMKSDFFGFGLSLEPCELLVSLNHGACLQERWLSCGR